MYGDDFHLKIKQNKKRKRWLENRYGQKWGVLSSKIPPRMQFNVGGRRYYFNP